MEVNAQRRMVKVLKKSFGLKSNGVRGETEWDKMAD
jgi:hypothetical protein